MGLKKSIRVAWLYVIGVVIIFAGIYLLFGIKYSQSYSFGVMLLGLLISGVGAVHGKRVLYGRPLTRTEAIPLPIPKPPAPPRMKPEAEKVKIIKILICPKCHAENQESHKFCSNCGTKLRK